MELRHYSKMIFNELKYVQHHFNRLLPDHLNIYIDDVDDKCKTCVSVNKSTGYWSDDEYRLRITINIKDAITYANINNINLLSASKLLFGHEIMHVALGHFSKIYEDYDKELLNIAGDLEINSILGINHPGIIPSDFGLPQYLDTQTYYKLLESQRKSNPEKFQNNKDKCRAKMGKNDQFDINNELEENGNNGKVRTDVISFDKNNKKNKDEENVKYNGNQTNLIDQLCSVRGNETATHIKDYSKVIGSKIKGLDEILNKITKNENTYSIIPTSKIPTYQKFNNRRKSDFILPGKRIVESGCQKKFKDKMTVFLDISGSTCSIKDSMMCISLRCHELGADIVFYDSDFKDVLRPNEQYCHLDPAGGTDVKAAIKQYIAKNKCKLERLYIFTDGADDFNGLEKICREYHVFQTNGYSIKELNQEEIQRSKKWR